MSSEVRIEVAEFEAKCKKLSLLLKNGMISQDEYDRIKRKLIKEMGV